jgi:hypothetical protein
MDRPLPNIVSTALQSHTNKVADLLPNSHSYVRSWQKKLQATLASHNTTLVQFLETSDSECVRADDTNIDAELGIPCKTLQEHLRTSMDLYRQTVSELFAKHASMQTKLDTLSTLQTKLESIHLEEGTEESLRLQTSILEYVRSKYASLQIKEEYAEFCRLYSRFLTLRSLAHMQCGFAEQYTAPICTICTADRVQTALVPCGHTFCAECSVKQRSQCYICRTTIKDRQKLFFL